jgi:DNA polymerase I-like protein with 3'-5' exonuclease and polymerase domains
MQANGVRVDVSAWTQLVEEERKRAAIREREAKELLGTGALDDQALIRALAARGHIVDVNDSAPAALIHIPGVEEALEARRAHGFVLSIGEPILRALERSQDGVIHPQWRQLGTRTGRMDAVDPALCNIPTHDRARGCFIPDEEGVFIVGDYAQAQLRIAAQYAPEPKFQELFRKGADLHTATAAAILGISPDRVTSDQRNRAKPANFGLLFDMWAPSLVAQARDNYGVDMTLAEAEAYRSAFFNAYPGIAEWHERFRRERPTMTRSLGGRICHLPTDARLGQRLAAPIQGAEADGVKRALCLLAESLRELGGMIVLTVYDEIVVEVPEGVAEESLELVKSSMIGGMQPLLPDVPVVVEAEIRRSWAKGS